MEFFIKPDPDSHEEFRRISSPEDITIVDPFCGLGHFLCCAFDLLAAMYVERGYRGPAADANASPSTMSTTYLGDDICQKAKPLLTSRGGRSPRRASVDRLGAGR